MKRVISRAGKNVLQRRALWFWVDIESEDVPAWAHAQAACLGSTEWRSDLIARHPEAASTLSHEGFAAYIRGLLKP